MATRREQPRRGHSLVAAGFALAAAEHHIIPLALGGTHEAANLQWAHLICNIRKGARMPD